MIGLDELRARLRAKQDELDLAVVRYEGLQIELEEERKVNKRLAENLAKACSRVVAKDGDMALLNLRISNLLGMLHMIRTILSDDMICLKSFGLDATHVEDAINQIDKYLNRSEDK